MTIHVVKIAGKVIDPKTQQVVNAERTVSYRHDGTKLFDQVRATPNKPIFIPNK